MLRRKQIQHKIKQDRITDLQKKLLEYTKRHFILAEQLTERLADFTGKSKDRIRDDAINEALQTGDLFSYFRRELTIWDEDYVTMQGEITGTG